MSCCCCGVVLCTAILRLDPEIFYRLRNKKYAIRSALHLHQLLVTGLRHAGRVLFCMIAPLSAPPVCHLPLEKRGQRSIGYIGVLLLALFSLIMTCERALAALLIVQVANRVFRPSVFFVDQAGRADVPQGVRGVSHHRDKAYSRAVGRFGTNSGRGVGRRSLNSTYFLAYTW